MKPGMCTSGWRDSMSGRRSGRMTTNWKSIIGAPVSVGAAGQDFPLRHRRAREALGPGIPTPGAAAKNVHDVVTQPRPIVTPESVHDVMTHDNYCLFPGWLDSPCGLKRSKLT